MAIKIFCSVFLCMILSGILMAQDQIVKVNGEEVFGKIIKVNSNDIVYKKKGNLEGPEYIEYKENILFIKYEDGTKVIFTPKDLSPENIIITPEVMPKRKNSVFFEFGGNNICYSLNYERRFFIKNKYNFISVKLGLAPIVPVIGYSGSVVNITASYNILRYGNNYFEAGIGLGKVTIATNAKSESNYSIELLRESYFYFTPLLGFRKQADNGFLFRVYLTMITLQGYNYNSRSDGPAFYPFVGVSLGFSF